MQVHEVIDAAPATPGQQISDWWVGPTHGASREAKLWRAVLDQALVDATTPRHKAGKGTGSTPTISDINEARTWFRKAEASFEEVCDGAGADPAVARQKALALISAIVEIEQQHFVEKQLAAAEAKKRKGESLKEAA